MNTAAAADRIRAAIRDVPDFPKAGILFKDITPILGDPELFAAAVDLLIGPVADTRIDKVAAVDARGFLFAGAISQKLNAGLVPIRKQGKLPYRTFEERYDLEYGSATLAVHQDAFRRGERVLLVDDLLATGGTALAAARLIERGGATVAGIHFLIELAFLKGREKLSSYTVYSAVTF